MTSQLLDLATARRMDPARRRRIRERAGVPRVAFARELGCTEWAVGAWETGRRNPTGALGAKYGRLLRQLATLADTDTSTDEVTIP